MLARVRRVCLLPSPRLRRTAASRFAALKTALLVVLGLALAATPAAAEVQLTIDGGRVTLSAKNATVGQILAEWAKVGQTKIVNGERVAGGPVSIELTNVPELDAIDILLRSAGGYVLAPRRVETAKTSRYDRILIVPTSSIMSGTPRPTVAAAPPPARPRPLQQPGPFQQRGLANQPGSEPDDNDGALPNAQGVQVQSPRPPVFNSFPQPAPQPTATPPPAAAPTSTLTAPVGVAVPGMVVPTPQPTGQPAPVPPQAR